MYPGKSKYALSDYKSISISVAPRIKFHYYVLLSICSIHVLIRKSRLRCNLYEVEKSEGKIRSRKVLTLKGLVVGNFMYNIYLPSLENCIYYVHCVHILSKNLCERLRHDTYYSKTWNICTIRNYIKRMSVNFNLKFQSEHFGNIISLLIEGYNIEIVDKELNNTCKFRTHFSNDSS